ncbi:MAG: protein kinase [Chloroflexi bacterium]|nr:protein kinase [Chloroflexota bacterium]
MAIVHAIGLPENDSERKAIAYLAKHLPGDQHIVFHNLELPARSGLPYEYDVIVVGEYAVYTVEVKGYQGLIRGNAQEWELESGAIYKSPIPLANKKAKVVADRLCRHSPLLGRVWVQPLIVLTDNRVRLRLNDDQADRVLHLDEAIDYILNPRRLPIRPEFITNCTDLICEAIFNQFRPLRRQHEIGDYRVTDTIGKNNLYTTLLAEHRLIRTRDRFILKVYSFDIYASLETRRKQEEWILRDANALHRLASHPNIVRAYPPFPWQDNHIVLPVEWVEGHSLRGLLDTGAEMGFACKIDIVRQMCEGLHYANSRGVIHRDLRPDNVIVLRQGLVKLVNFDCARVEGDDLRTIASRVGRQLDQRYVAPEVWQNAGAAGSTSDLYAAGVILFELLAGQPPYQKIKEVFVGKGLPCLPTQINPELPSDVDEVVARMCAFEPDERYGSLAEVAEDLAIIG